MKFFKALAQAIQLTSYKIHTPKISLGALIAINLITTANLVIEIFIDLETTSLSLMILFWALGLILLGAFLKWPSNKIVNSLIIVLPFALLESLFLANQKSFHSIQFWFVLIPIAALIIEGVRSSQIWFIIVLATYIINAKLIGYYYLGNYSILVMNLPYTITHIMFLVGVFSSSLLLYTLLGNAYAKVKKQSEVLHELQLDISSKKELLEKYQNALIQLNRNELIFNNGLKQVYKTVCQTASYNLNVNRVSIWFFEDNNSRLVRNFLYESENESDELISLHEKDYPSYFSAVKQKPIIIANHAYESEDTHEFSKDYLPALNIKSMLDSPILLNQEPIGVICCESKYAIRNWTTEDTLFVQSLSDIISISYQNEKIKNLMKQVRQQNYELVAKSNSIETMNKELSSVNDQLTTLNNSLEETVISRTAELEIQNKQLTEYAFINSHLLRAPLARVLGLSQLIMLEKINVRDKELIDALLTSTAELDEIIRKISELLYAGNNISREDIAAIISRNFNTKG